MYTVAQAADDGLTLREVLADVPHDPAAIVAYILLGLFVFFVWYGNRASVQAKSPRPAGDPVRGTEPAQGDGASPVS